MTSDPEWAEKRIQSLMLKLVIAKEALEFYSTKQQWGFYCGCCADGTTPLENDLGEKADQALEVIK